MPETSSFSPEDEKNLRTSPDAMASALANAKKEIEIAESIAADAVGENVEAEKEKKQKKENRHKRIIALVDGELTKRKHDSLKGELRSNLAKNKERKQKLKERGEDDYESFEVTASPIRAITSEGGSASGEIHNDDELEGTDMEETLKDLARLGRENAKEVKPQLKEEDKFQLDRILEAFEEAGDDEKGTNKLQKFLDFMLQTSDMVLTKERVENDRKVNRYLQSNFKDQELGFKYEDFLHALPTDEDYKENGLGRHVEESERPNKTKKIREFSEETEESLDFIRNMKDSGVGETPGLEPLKSKAKSKAKPPRIKSLAEAAEESAAKNVPFISQNNIEESRRSEEEKYAAEAEDRRKLAPRRVEPGIPRVKSEVLEEARARVAAMPEAARKRAEAGSLVQKLSGMSTKEGAARISREVAAGKQKSLDEIAERYVKKLGTKENAHKFLMGPEVKGWFKGGQRRDQENYKKTFKELHG